MKPAGILASRMLLLTCASNTRRDILDDAIHVLGIFYITRLKLHVMSTATKRTFFATLSRLKAACGTSPNDDLKPLGKAGRSLI